MSTVPNASAAGARSAELLKSLLSTDSKLVRFALLGAAGCLVGALLGEIWLAVFRLFAPAGPAQAVCLVVDCSASMLFDEVEGQMNGRKLSEMKAAAREFVGRQNLKRDAIGLVRFSNGASTAAKLSHDAGRLQEAIDSLQGHGSTAMDAGLDAASHELQELPDDLRNSQAPRSVLLFTDGQPDEPHAALEAARACREQKIRIVAIGTGDADVEYLAKITGDPALVFHARAGNFAEGFQRAEKAIYSGSLVESGGGAGLLLSLLQIVGWTAALACGVSLALIAGQNHYLHRAILTPREATLGVAGSLAVGVVAGVPAQLLFSVAGVASAVTSQIPLLGSLIGQLFIGMGRIVGWAILGALVARGLAMFVPNVEPRRAWLGGAAGGAIAAVAFLLAAWLGNALGLGDVPARLLGAAILGAMIGAMVALVEAAFRSAWLEVRYGAKEMISVSLGATPVKIGSDNRACTVYARGARALAFQYRLEEDKILCLDYATEKSRVALDGDEQVIGHVTVTVRTSRGETGAGGAKAPPTMVARPAPPPPPVKSQQPPPPKAPPPVPDSTPQMPAKEVASAPPPAATQAVAPLALAPAPPAPSSPAEAKSPPPPPATKPAVPAPPPAKPQTAVKPLAPPGDNKGLPKPPPPPPKKS